MEGFRAWILSSPHSPWLNHFAGITYLMKMFTFLLFSLKKVIWSYSGRAQKFWASYISEKGWQGQIMINYLIKKALRKKWELGESVCKSQLVGAQGWYCVCLDFHWIAVRIYVLIPSFQVKHDFTWQGASGGGLYPRKATCPWSCNSLAFGLA